MSAPLVAIKKHPGIYKRGAKYVVAYRANGRQKRETVRTLKDAIRIKRARETDRDRGELQEDSRVRFREYAEEWVGRYMGNGKRGFTDDTRLDYRRDLERYAYPFFDDQLGRTVSAITRRDLSRWIGWLCDAEKQGKHRDEIRAEQARAKGQRPPKPGGPVVLADATVRRISSPVRACLSTAADEDLIRANPASELKLPHRPQIEEEDESEAKALTREQLAAFLDAVDAEWHLFFDLLASTGVRWGEAAALRWRDLDLDGEEVKIRRALSRRRVKGEPATFKVPKSKYSKRNVPLSADLVEQLKTRREAAEFDGDDDLVFGDLRGQALRQENVRRRVMKPAAETAEVPWIGFHTFRHTCASLLFAQGRNLIQVSRWLGHHSPSFTASVYGHLLDEGVGGAIDMKATLDLSNVVSLETARKGRAATTEAKEARA